MKLPIYQVDAFADELFSGNPAAVVIHEIELSIEIMQKIAAENNLSETAFVYKKDQTYKIRWFTPTVEVDLCGHATLAAAHVLFVPMKKSHFHQIAAF
uniref:PhzF family phenazine biosynthesis protein n=1 Tax=Candidatus Marithrix sp. Canyon 246 TaxID=1827136 RepID=UPI000B0A50DE|nr:PhzF family phenazine biosynthesis isomerase [Candidatus Marithrix sp. Canyon 246]